AEGVVSSKATSMTAVNVGFPETNPKVSFALNLVKKNAPAYNVIGILPGIDPKLKSEAIVIGAHYDHLGHGGSGSLPPNSTEIHHGADDNASGVAAMLELARQFSLERKNRRTIIFIAFSGEEEGLIGSKYYVNYPVFPLENTVAMINLDMVGRLNENKLTIGGIGTAAGWKDLLQNANTTESGFAALTNLTNVPPLKVKNPSNRGAYFDLQLNEDGFGPSDHASFYGKKIPVLFLFSGTHSDYHKPTDTVDKINYSGERSLVEFAAAIFKRID